MVYKEEVVCVCSVCMCHTNTGETSQGLPSLQLGPYWSSSMALALSPPHPSPCFPTLLVHHSPAHRPLVQQLSQRTSWYSQAPAVEEKNINHYTSVSPPNIPFMVEGSPVKKTALGRQVWIPQLFFSKSLPILLYPN